MAHMNRGSSPINSIGDNGDNRIKGRVFHHHRYCDNDLKYNWPKIICFSLVIIYLLIQVIFPGRRGIFRIRFDDPIRAIKNTYINLLMIVEIVILVSSIGVTFILKTKEKLLVALKVILIISLCIISIFGIVIMSYNNTYNKEKFEEIYISSLLKTEPEIKMNNKKIPVESAIAIKVITEKDSYVEKCILEYKRFQRMVIILFVMFVVEICLNVHLLITTMNKQSKEERLKKDDIVLYDDGENVKL